MTPQEQRKSEGAALKKRRKAAELTQEEMASRVGVPTTTYVNWELGRTTPSTVAKKKLDEVLANLDGHGKALLAIPIAPNVRKNIEALARAKGTTPEEEMAKALEAIFGSFAVAATVGAAVASAVAAGN